MLILFKYIVKVIDGLLYGFIGPFSVLYIIPQFLKNIFQLNFSSGFGIFWLEQVGKYLMWSGGALAIYCSLLMVFTANGTPSVLTPPKQLLSKGIFGIVRHPMMWSINIVLIGEALTYGSLVLSIWFIAWLRISHLIVVNYEEPQLVRRFGESYNEYCKVVPRWIPRFKSVKY